MNEYPHLHIGHASDIRDRRDRRIYRALEMLPGALAWATLLGVVFLSWARPVWIAFFIIGFDLYWLIKTVYLSFYLRSGYQRMRKHLDIDWLNRVASLPKERYQSFVEDWRDLRHLIILPVGEREVNADLVRGTLHALARSRYPLETLYVVLSAEECAGHETAERVRDVGDEFRGVFGSIINLIHPAGLPNERPGKGSNIAWAAGEALKEIIHPRRIPYHNVIVSAFDDDTRVPPGYFACVTYHYLTHPKPTRTSYQPIPVYTNNIWQAPALARVISFSATFWHMMQQGRPERATTFSSHSMSLEALVKVGLWQRNMVSEDSRIFWQCFLRFDGDYTVQPLFYPLYMDANVAKTFFRTMKNQYRQQRRWGWGAENVPYFLFGFLKNKKIPLRKKLFYGFVMIESFHSWATNALIIFLLGWLPLILGGDAFLITELSYNLPRITRTLMTLAMVGLVSSAFLSMVLLPHRPPEYGKYRYVIMAFQWLFLPFTIILFGAIPGLEAQTRLMFGRYMGFWITEKVRKVS